MNLYGQVVCFVALLNQIKIKLSTVLWIPFILHIVKLSNILTSPRLGITLSLLDINTFLVLFSNSINNDNFR